MYTCLEFEIRAVTELDADIVHAEVEEGVCASGEACGFWTRRQNRGRGELGPQMSQDGFFGATRDGNEATSLKGDRPKGHCVALFRVPRRKSSHQNSHQEEGEPPHQPQKGKEKKNEMTHQAKRKDEDEDDETQGRHQKLSTTTQLKGRTSDKKRRDGCEGQLVKEGSKEKVPR